MTGETICKHGTNTGNHCLFCCKTKDCNRCDQISERWSRQEKSKGTMSDCNHDGIDPNDGACLDCGDCYTQIIHDQKKEITKLKAENDNIKEANKTLADLADDQNETLQIMNTAISSLRKKTKS